MTKRRNNDCEKKKMLRKTPPLLPLLHRLRLPISLLPPQTSTTKSFDNKGNGYNRNSKPSSNNNSSNPSGVVEDKVQEKDTEKDTEKDKDTTTRSATDTTTDTDVDVCYPYEQLKSPGPYPPGVTTDRELLLSAADFLTVRAGRMERRAGGERELSRVYAYAVTWECAQTDRQLCFVMCVL